MTKIVVISSFAILATIVAANPIKVNTDPAPNVYVPAPDVYSPGGYNYINGESYQRRSYAAPIYETPYYEVSNYKIPCYGAPSYEKPYYDTFAPTYYEIPSNYPPYYDANYIEPFYDLPSYNKPFYGASNYIPSYEASVPYYGVPQYEVPVPSYRPALVPGYGGVYDERPSRFIDALLDVFRSVTYYL